MFCGLDASGKQLRKNMGTAAVSIRYFQEWMEAFFSRKSGSWGLEKHDTKLLEATLDKIFISHPAKSEQPQKNLCLDVGYIGSKQTVEKRHYTPICVPEAKNVKKRSTILLSKPAAG